MRHDAGIRDIVNERLRELGRNQEWLGDAMARTLRRSEPWSQSQVSAWLLGRIPLGPSEAFAMEKVLEYKPGQLTRHLGYVPADARPLGRSTETVIATDERLSKRDRRLLAALYREMRRD